MKNYNYNLIKLLHISLDNAWRIEQHYLKDAADLDCDCSKILEEMKSDAEKHIEALSKEIKKHDLE
ncbi:MAG: hypothetical protein OEV93_01710 [Candidatus Moranbacteria bacterium]|nr:hypothetical protein [Candidatus Moranbacteria bacterium]